VVTIRSFASFLVFTLLLCTVFPSAQIGWSFSSTCGSIGNIGSGQACDFSDAGEPTDSEDDSPQETLEDFVTSRLDVSDGESSRFLVSMKAIPPSTLLISGLFHPPTSQS
jgi:hypothetical protein